MNTIPDKYEDLDVQQKEHFARMGFKIYQNVISSPRISGEAEKLLQTVCKAQDDIFKASLQSLAVKANNSIDELIHKVE